MRGLVVIVVDESSAMVAVASKESKKNLAESVSTAVNSLLGRLAPGKDVDLALIGYRSEADGAANVSCRWGGALSGCKWVATANLAASPLTVEQRYRKVVVDGQLQEQAFSFPIWYQPQPGGSAPQVAAFAFCRQLIGDWAACVGTLAAQPIILHVFAGPSGDGNSLKVVREIQQLAIPGGAPLVFQAHLITSDSLGVPPTLYPATPAYLTGQLRELFERSDVMPDALAAHMKKAGAVILPKARGLVYNARLVDLAKLLTVADAYVEQLSAPCAAPSAAATETAPPFVSSATLPSEPQTTGPTLPESSGADETAILAVPTDVGVVTAECPAPPSVGISSLTSVQPGLLLFVFDRSVADPYGSEPKNVCVRLQRRMGDLLEKMVRFGQGTVDVGIVSYGADFTGQPDVRSSLEGGLTGRPYARDSDLTAGAIRIDEFVEERSDGASGILSIPHKQPILVAIEPTAATTALPAFQKASELTAAWIGEHSGNPNVPVIVHLTRGQLDPSDAAQAVGALTSAAPGVVVYHIVETEMDHLSIFYPADDGSLQEPFLKALWGLTSPLLGREGLISDNPQISEKSRGMVINAGGELMLDALKRAVAV